MMLSSLRKDIAPNLLVAHLLVGESDKRLVLTFYPSSNDTITISHNSGITLGDGITLTPGCNPIILHHELHGDEVRKEWYAIYTSGNFPIVWIEALLCPCKIEGYT